VTTSSYGDAGDYQGHLTTINLTSGTQHVFNALCSDKVDVHFAAAPSAPDCHVRGGGIWARAGVVYVRETDRIYLTTGNGPFAPARHAWGESVLALHPDGTGVRGTPLDSYTPANYAALNATDHDMGSTAPALVPTLARSRIRHLAVQGDKDGKLRLLNLDDLSGHGRPGDVGGEVGTVIRVPQGEGVLAQPVVWVDPRDSSTWVFVGTKLGLSGLRLTVDAGTPRSWGGTPRFTVMWSTTTITSTSPLVANNILYSASSGHIRALDPTSGHLLWQDTSIGPVHMSSPIIANGVLYVADESHGLTAYAVTRQGVPAAGTAR
jgi:outer membrane protein assembly factor BamB